MRKLVMALLALGLLVPAASYALGLGDIHLHSALNQPLDADIDLLSVNPSQADRINVTLGSYEDFAQVGIDRPSVLMYLKFKVVKGKDGAYRIHVSSQKPIREPFLDFLIEVNWPSGRLLREYTMLIDPPGMMKKEAAPAVQAPTAAAPAKPAAKAAPAASPSVTAPASGLPAPAARSTGGKSLRYGPVKKDDTLWSIAEKMRPNKSVSVQQVMMALLKANPEAFYDNNVNRLKAGYVLRIDDPKLIRAMSEAEATRAIKHQTRAWRDYRQQAAGEAQQRHATQAKAAPSKAVATREQPHLKLAAPEKGKGTKGAGTKANGKAGGDAKHQLMLAQEDAAAKAKENQNLRKRVQELEKQVASMQRLLSLKNNDLAAMQQQMHKGAKAAAGTQPQAAKPEAATKPEAQAKAETATAAAQKPSKTAPEKSQAKPAKPAPAPTHKPVPKHKPVVPASQPKQPSMIQGILDNMLANPVVLGGIAIALLSILALVWLIIRRRRASEFQESILSGGTSSMLSNKTGEGAESEDTSFFSDFAVSGMGNIQTEDNEVDPLTEADVYMAYGRYQQAEELLKEAIERTPERHELLVKLLELYYTTKNIEAFEARADEANKALDGSGPLWDKVLGMGHELLPENPMFSSAPTAASEGGGESHDEVPQDDILDIGLDLDALAEEMEPSDEETAAAGGGNDDLGMDLGVDFSDLDESGTAAEGDEKKEEDSLLDFDLSGLDESAEGAPETKKEEEKYDNAIDYSKPEMPFEETPAEPQATTEAAPEEALPMSQDSGFETVDKIDSEAQSGSDEELLDFDLGDLGDLGSEASTEEAGTMGGSDEVSFDLDLDESLTSEPEASEREAVAETTDLDLDSLAPETESAPAAGEAKEEASGGGMLNDDELFADLDENDTKLDLAKAYIDMGDGEGARGILDEVMQAGNDEQKQQAEELLKQVS